MEINFVLTKLKIVRTYAKEKNIAKILSKKRTSKTKKLFEFSYTSLSWRLTRNVGTTINKYVVPDVILRYIQIIFVKFIYVLNSSKSDARPTKILKINFLFFNLVWNSKIIFAEIYESFATIFYDYFVWNMQNFLLFLLEFLRTMKKLTLKILFKLFLHAILKFFPF